MAEVDTQLMDMTSEEQFLRNFKAVYNAMTAKPDCRSKAYPVDVIIGLEDIVELNDKIFEKFRVQYENVGFSVNVIVSIKGRQKLEFSTWKSFEDHKWTESEIITGIVMTWEFNVKLPKLSVPQKHTLTVKMSNGIRPEEMFGLILSGKLDKMEEIDQSACPIVARIDFVDPGIGNEVLEIVSEWVKGLRKSDSEKGKITLFMQRNKRKLAYALNYLTTLVAMMCSIIIVNKFLVDLPLETIGELKSDQLCQLINLLFVCGIICFLVCKVSDLFCNAIFKILTDYGDEHTFAITKGDKNQQAEFRKSEKADRMKILINFSFNMLINIICGVVTYFVTKGK